MTSIPPPCLPGAWGGAGMGVYKPLPLAICSCSPCPALLNPALAPPPPPPFRLLLTWTLLLTWALLLTCSILANKEPFRGGDWRKTPYIPRCVPPPCTAGHGETLRDTHGGATRACPKPPDRCLCHPSHTLVQAVRAAE